MTLQCRSSGYRPVAFVALFHILLLTTGCSSISEFVADAMPHWAGGLPAEAPPRPSDPRYEEHARALNANAEGPAKSEASKPESGDMPSQAKR